MKEKLLRIGKWMLRNTLLAAGTLFVLLLFFEFAYRYSWFEFYGTEITMLNERTNNKSGKSTVLVLGDSFTADEHNYVNILNDSLPDILFVNAGIPGVGMGELATIAERRINEFHPNKIILQVYVGNDLLDEEKPVNWSTLSLSRNCYWSVSNSFYVVRYLNYKLGQFKSRTNLAVESGPTKNNNSFSVAQFSAREKMLTLADADYVESSIRLNAEYKLKYQLMKSHLDEIAELCSENKIPLYIVVIPVNCQVNAEYRNHLIEIGAEFHTTDSLHNTYPFLDQIVSDYNHTNITVLNPLPTLRNAEEMNARVYYANDIHLNQEGQEVLARFLLPLFQEENH